MKIFDNNGFIAKLPKTLLIFMIQEWLTFADSDLLRMALLNEEDSSNLVKRSFESYYLFEGFSEQFVLAVRNQSEFLTGTKFSTHVEIMMSEDFKKEYETDVRRSSAWITCALFSEEIKNLIGYDYYSLVIREQYFQQLVYVIRHLIGFAKIIKIDSARKLSYFFMRELSKAFPNICRTGEGVKRNNRVQGLIDDKIKAITFVDEKQDIACDFWRSKRIKQLLFSADLVEAKNILANLEIGLFNDLRKENLTEEAKIRLRYGVDSTLAQCIIAANEIVDDETFRLSDLIRYSDNRSGRMVLKERTFFCASVYRLILLYQDNFENGAENYILSYMYYSCIAFELIILFTELCSYCAYVEEAQYDNALSYMSILLSEMQLLSGSEGLDFIIPTMYSKVNNYDSFTRVRYKNMLQQLLDAGADPNCLDVYEIGKHIRDIEILRMLFKAGLKADPKNEYEVPSLLSQYIRRFDVGDQYELQDVKSLIAHDVINLKDDEGMTPLHILLYSYAMFIKSLAHSIDYDADISAHCLKYFNILKLLLEAHAEVTEDDLKRVPRVSDDASVKENTKARFFEQRDSGFYRDNMFPLLWQAHVYSVDAELKNAVTYQS